jgi:hypothetical protein
MYEGGHSAMGKAKEGDVRGRVKGWGGVVVEGKKKKKKK